MCDLKYLRSFGYFIQKTNFTYFFRHFTWISSILGQLIHMACIVSTLGFVETGFWTLSNLHLELFRENFIFTYLFLCRSIGHMRDQSSQFVPNSSLHVAWKMKICFQTIIVKGVNFIVNRCPLMCEVGSYVEGQNTLISFWYSSYWYSLVKKEGW